MNILIKYSNKHPYHYLERKGYFHVHLFKLLLLFGTEIYYIFLEVTFLFLFKGFLGVETFSLNAFLLIFTYLIVKENKFTQHVLSYVTIATI